MGNTFSYSTETPTPTPTPTTITEPSKISRRYGWKRDLPDCRDYIMEFAERPTKSTKIDLRDKCPPIYDQGKLDSCTSQAIAAAFFFDKQQQQQQQQQLQSQLPEQGGYGGSQQSDFQPSRLYIYYNERMIQGTIDYDYGASIRDTMKAINRWGVCNEKIWPYDVDNFNNRPTDECYFDAINHCAIRYHRVKQRSLQLKSALDSGYPVVFGISVYDSMESPDVAQTGNVPMPEPSDKLLGGQVILLIGYDDERRVWIFRNSWGTEWGENGYGTLPYKYLAPKNMLTSDFWIMEKVKNPEIDDVINDNNNNNNNNGEHKCTQVKDQRDVGSEDTIVK